MNHWAVFLAQSPPTLQRLIAATQRVSLPRRCAPAERLTRLRAAICRPAAVRATYFLLDPAAQQALQQLRQVPRGLTLATLNMHFGPLRPLTELRADRTPRSLSERLLLLGWLLPRPATRNHPTRYLLPPELRAWLPVPLTTTGDLPADDRRLTAGAGAAAHVDHDCQPSRHPGTPGAGDDDAQYVAVAAAVPRAGVVPLLCDARRPNVAAPLATLPAIRAATAILVAAATTPLPLRADGRLTAAALRVLTPRLAPLDAPEVAALCGWLMPILGDLGLLAPHGSAVVAGSAARRMLAAPLAERRQMLVAAWVRAPRREWWLVALRVTTHGLDWPALRRRLCAWAEASAHDPSVAYAQLCAAFGPLGDGTTHGLRTPRRRNPWSPQRAAAVWAAACHGPLAWLGEVPWAGAAGWHGHAGEGWHSDVVQTPAAAPDGTAAVTTLLVQVPHGQDDADLLILAPCATFVASNAVHATYQLSRATLARARGRGHDLAPLWAVLRRQCAALPDEVVHRLMPTGGLRMETHTMLLSDDPAALAAALRRRSARRAVNAQIAPGVALVAPGQAAALQRALARDGRAVAVPEAAQLLTMDARPLATDGVMPAEAAPAPVGVAAPAVHDGADPAAVAARQAEPSAAPASLGTPVAMIIDQVRVALRRRQAIGLHYQGATQPTPRERVVRPLRLERHGPWYYLHAYCLLARAERCFRLDRVHCVTAADGHVPDAADASKPARRAPIPRCRAPRRPRSAPHSGFFAGPPDPPPDSPLVRVWLEE